MVNQLNRFSRSAKSMRSWCPVFRRLSLPPPSGVQVGSVVFVSNICAQVCRQSQPGPRGQVVRDRRMKALIMYSIKQSVSEIEMQCVFCEVGISLLNIVYTKLEIRSSRCPQVRCFLHQNQSS
jgi:hypothetical protein